METDPEYMSSFTVIVLIVPCGMETRHVGTGRVKQFRINCTLRNGNSSSTTRAVKTVQVLIVPCGMETSI